MGLSELAESFRTEMYGKEEGEVVVFKPLAEIPKEAKPIEREVLPVPPMPEKTELKALVSPEDIERWKKAYGSIRDIFAKVKERVATKDVRQAQKEIDKMKAELEKLKLEEEKLKTLHQLKAEREAIEKEMHELKAKELKEMV